MTGPNPDRTDGGGISRRGHRPRGQAIALRELENFLI